jgi:cysteinyl-tRNA synthetase
MNLMKHAGLLEFLLYSTIEEKYILEKIEARIQARKLGNYKLADKIRDELLKNGIVIEDKQNKTEWKYK